jgi:hypothetical protein
MIPVLIIHEGYKEYLKINLEITGKNNKIYLIGDKSLEHLGNIKNVTFVNIDKYNNNLQIIQYANNFINYSSNSKLFEFLCFKRVFILKLFMNEYNFDKIFHIDSDNILLKNINDYIFSKDIAYVSNKNWHKNRMSNSIHSGLLDKKFVLEFEKLYEDIYINKSKLHLIKEKINYHTKNNNFVNGGICDMTLYYLLNQEKIIDVENLLENKVINNKKIVFMNNINNGEGPDSKEQYELINNIIKIQKSSNGEDNYLYDKINKQFLILMNIHFQGGAKSLMNENLKKFLNY